MIVACVGSMLFSCSKEETSVYTHQSDLPPIQTQVAQLSADLTGVNREFTKDKEARAGFFSKFARFCAIATADVTGGCQMAAYGGRAGAYVGGKVGLAVGGPKGFVTGVIGGAVGGAAIAGTVGAIGASYSAHKGLQAIGSSVSIASANTSSLSISSVYYQPHVMKLDDVVDAYRYAKQAVASSSISSGESVSEVTERLRVAVPAPIPVYKPEESVVISFPTKTSESIALFSGKVHNVALDYLMHKDKYQSNNGVLVELSDFEKGIIQSDEFKKNYDAMAQNSYYSHGGRAYVDKLDENKARTKQDYVIQLFLKTFQYAENKQELTTLVDKYMSIVNRSAELTQEEKQAIYNSLSIAIHSYDFWTNTEFE